MGTPENSQDKVASAFLGTHSTILTITAIMLDTTGC